MGVLCRAAAAQVSEIAALRPARAALLFSVKERRAASARAFPGETLAARLAAKRAFAAALFCLGWEWPFPFSSVEIASEPDGRPVLRVRDRNLRKFCALNVRRALVTLSHTRSLGCAAVTLEWGSRVRPPRR